MSHSTKLGSPGGRHRFTTRLTVGAVTALVAAVVTCTAIAGGHRAIHVSGDYELDFARLGTTDCTPIDTIRLRCTTTDMGFDYHGDLTGSTTIQFEQIVNCRTGVTRGSGTETFTGSIAGAPGTVTWHVSFGSEFDCLSGFPSNLRAIANLKKRQGTGELAGLKGTLRFDDTTYRGVLE
jgi:hypothetical protein